MDSLSHHNLIALSDYLHDDRPAVVCNDTDITFARDQQLASGRIDAYRLIR